MGIAVPHPVPEEVMRKDRQAPTAVEEKLEHTSLIKGGKQLAKKFQPKAFSKGGYKK